MPLMFDMPLEELQTYQGTNPVPRDFDGFWDAGLADMRAVDPQVELTPAEFRTSFADCSHMYFTGVGGARIHAKLLRPRNISQTHPAVLIYVSWLFKQFWRLVEHAGVCCTGFQRSRTGLPWTRWIIRG
jgi:cephalosporin-C deacetylase-like acetyl esterase